MKKYLNENKAKLSNVEKKILTRIGVEKEYRTIPDNDILKKIVYLAGVVDIKEDDVNKWINHMKTQYEDNKLMLALLDEKLKEEEVGDVELGDDEEIASVVSDVYSSMNRDIQINFLYVILMVKYVEGLARDAGNRGVDERGKVQYPIPTIEDVKKLIEDEESPQERDVQLGNVQTTRKSEPPAATADLKNASNDELVDELEKRGYLCTLKDTAPKKANLLQSLLNRGRAGGGKKPRTKRTKRRTTGGKKSRRRLRKRTTLKGGKRKRHRTRRRR